MTFIQEFLRNLALLFVIFLGVYILAPDIVGQVVNLFGMLFGPLAILLIVVAALPRKRRRA